MRQAAFSPLLTLHEERFLTVLGAFDDGARSVEPSSPADASALRATRERLLLDWKGARTEAERRQLVALGAAVGVARFGLRNVNPVLTADVLYARLTDTAAQVQKTLAVSDVYPTEQAYGVYTATVGLIDEMRRLIDTNVRVGDTQQWTDAVLGITRRMWARWDVDMPRYRQLVIPAHDAGAVEVRFSDPGFRAAVLRQVDSVDQALRELAKVQGRKSSLNDETWLYRSLDSVNRFLHAVGGTVKDAAGGVVQAAGGAVKEVVGSFGIKDALLAGAVVLAGGFVAYQALAKR